MLSKTPTIDSKTPQVQPGPNLDIVGLNVGFRVYNVALVPRKLPTKKLCRTLFSDLRMEAYCSGALECKLCTKTT